MLTPDTAQAKIADLDKRLAEMASHRTETLSLLRQIEGEIAYLSGQRQLLADLLAETQTDATRKTDQEDSKLD